MAIVQRKNKSGLSFQVKVKDPDGKWYPTPAFDSQEAAKEEELRLIKLKRKGAKAITDDARKVSLNEYWEVWSVENRNDVSDGWKLSQDQMFRDYIERLIGGLKLIEIGAPEIGKVMKRMKDLGRSGQTTQHVYNLLHRMLRDAVEYYEMLSVNPVKSKFHRPKVRKTQRDFLKPAEAWTLLDAVRDHYIGPAVWLQTLAGLRPGEVQALVMTSVLFDLDQILIRSCYDKKMKRLQAYPKQEDWAYAPMPRKLKEYLRGLDRKPDDFVVSGFRGGMLKYDGYNKALKRMCRAAGVKEMEPHELRHSCTEIYIQAGASTEDIRRLLNHKSLTSTKGYIHRTDERLNSIAQSITSGGSPERVSQIVSQMGNLERVSSQEEVIHVH
jgi:integrase